MPALLPLSRSVGRRIAELRAASALTQEGLALWRLEPPLRIREQISGLQVNGDMESTTSLRVFRTLDTLIVGGDVDSGAILTVGAINKQKIGGHVNGDIVVAPTHH